MPSPTVRLRTSGLRPHSLRWTLAGAFLLAFPAAGSTLQAQALNDRAVLERFRDSLASTSDSVGLLRLEKRMIDSTKVDRNNSLLHLKLGFLSLRLGDLGGQSHYDDAASEFQWAIDLQPSWPYAWYGMGLAEYGVGDSQVSFITGLKTMLGKDALTRSAVAFAKSAEVDPAFVRGLVDLANTALRQRVNIKLGVALEALRRAGKTMAGGDPQVQLARGRVEREVGDGDSALVAFNGYLQSGPDRALGLLEISRTLFLLGRFDGTAPYFEGAAIDDSAAVAGYRADLATIASDSVLREFDQQGGSRRAAYLRRFWGQRDQIELRGKGERLREHYRRLFYARKNFRLVSTSRHYDIVERYRSGSRDFDDRGVIYLRHGDPTQRASYAAPGLEPNESWRYSRPEGDLIFHFIAREDVQDFKLVESLFDVLGFSDAVKLQDNGAAENAVAEQLMLSREQLSPIYRRLQGVGHMSAGRYQTQERRVGQESIALGTTSDSYELQFTKDLKAKWEVLAVGDDSTGHQVQIAYAIAGSSLEPVTVTRGYLYSVRLRFVAIDSRGEAVASLDTTRHFVAPAPVPPTEHLVGRVGVTVPSGELQYRLAVQQGEAAGVSIPRDSVRVGAINSSAIGLSDLVLGSRSANLSWHRSEEDTVLFNPLRTYRRSEEMELFYQIEGLRPTPYNVELTIRKNGSSGGLFKKIFGGGGAALRLKFDEQATTPVVSTHRTLKLDRLKPGNYVLELVVTDAAGRRDRRRQEFQVVEEKEGKRGSREAGKGLPE
ncbi:MAG: GWxTD domain-containing protein [Gemmatimonadales bacterium]